MPASRSSFRTRSRDAGLDAARQRLAGRHRPRDQQALLVEQPDPLHDLLHRRAVALERALEADLHEVEADLACVELQRDQVRLLRDPHRRARVAAAELDDARERCVGDRAAVRGEALGQRRRATPPASIGRSA